MDIQEQSALRGHFTTQPPVARRPPAITGGCLSCEAAPKTSIDRPDRLTPFRLTRRWTRITRVNLRAIVEENVIILLHSSLHVDGGLRRLTTEGITGCDVDRKNAVIPRVRVRDVVGLHK